MLSFIKIKYVSEKILCDAYRFFFHQNIGKYKEKKGGRKEGRRKEGRKEERLDCEKEKKGGKRELRLRIIGKRARTGNRRSRYPMLLLRAVSVSGDTKTNVFMR